MWAPPRAFTAARASAEDLLTRDVTASQEVTQSISENGRSLPLVGLEALDVLNIGVAVTGSSRELLFANQIAQHLLTTRDGMEVTARGTLETCKRTNPPLRELIQTATQAAMFGDFALRNEVVAVERGSGKRPLTLMVRSVKEPQTGLGSGEPAVVIFVLDPERPVRAPEAALRQLYGFTAREAHLANLLMEGNTLDQCCDHLNIRPSTARMHLGSLFAKTGVQRQGQLISLLLKSLGMVCLKGGERRPGLRRSARDLHEVRASREASTGRSSEILAASLKALDLLDIGMAVTNSSRQLLFANQTAEHVLVTGDGVEVTANGVVDTLTKACKPSLGELMRGVIQAAVSGVSEPKDAILAVERRDGAKPFMLLIRSVIEPLSRLDASDPAVLIFLFDSSGPVRATESGLRQLYKLTASEARIASLLMEGKTLDDCCDDLDIRPSTARMHLGNLFAKTGVQRQGQLISLFLKSFGMLRSEGTTSRP
jgi:DNA-binding CsgD family transcriptional regulator